VIAVSFEVSPHQGAAVRYFEVAECCETTGFWTVTKRQRIRAWR
jgi:hypothetical protein